MSKTPIEEEQERLDTALGEIRQEQADPGPGYAPMLIKVDPQTEVAFDGLNFASLLEEPYFGRMDFQQYGHAPETFYIGKTGFEGPTVKILDWRAPAANMFYDHTGYYEVPTPEGTYTIQGHLYLVRHIVIQDSQVLDISDVHTEEEEIHAPFLAMQLKRTGADRLRNVVQSIQAAQNRIIRLPADKHLILQGFAGTGKSVCILHRLAYLIYKESLKAHELLFLAPHPHFLQQIKVVLPDLNVEGVPQLSLAQFARHLTGGRVVMKGYGAGKPVAASYLQQVEEYVQGRVLRLCEKIRDFVYQTEDKFGKKNPIIIPGGQIASWMLRDRASIQERVENVYNRLQETLTAITEPGKKTPYYSPAQVAQILEAYFSNWDDTSGLFEEAVTWYRQTFDADLDLESKKGSVVCHTPQDLAALTYLYTAVVRSPQRAYRHIFLDEAHGVETLWLHILKRCLMARGTMVLAGDVYQNDLPGGIEDWRQAIDVLGQENVVQEKLTISYRQTRAIAEEVMRVLQRIDPEAAAGAEIAGAEGNSPGKGILNSKEDTETVLVPKIKAWQDKGLKTLAVLCPDADLAGEIHARLRKACSARLLSDTAVPVLGEQYVLVAPVYLVGGMEFDGVILLAPEKMADKRLYKGISRATHELEILEVK